jgi:hypothetical protein
MFQAVWVSVRNRTTEGDTLAWRVERMVTLLLPGTLFFAGGLSLIADGGGGLYWIFAGTPSPSSQRSAGEARHAKIAVVSVVPHPPGWWMASDGKWYPPELHPAHQLTPPQAPPPMPPPMPSVVPPKIDRPRRWPSIAILIFGSLCVIVGFVLFFVVGFVGLLNSTVYETPVHVSLQCHVGDYLVYQNTATSGTGPAIGLALSGPLTITPDQVKVVGSNGSRVPTWAGNGAETITKNSGTFNNAVGFHAAVAGTYSVTVESPRPTSVIIAPSLGNQVVRAVPWLILSGVGMLIATVGLVLLIVTSNRRSRAHLQAVAAGAPWSAVT